MIDLHTHTLLSDGDLLPAELVRRALVNGYSAIGLTDHVDHSNIKTVLYGLNDVSKVLNRFWDIKVLPGVEITHVPVETYSELVRMARRKGAKVVVGHGESPVEPVIPGTNVCAINAGVDILAHPGMISDADAKLAASKDVFLEITCRDGHNKTNKHVFDTATRNGAKLVLNTDAHSPADILTLKKRDEVLRSLTDSEEIISGIIRNSEDLVKKRL